MNAVLWRKRQGREMIAPALLAAVQAACLLISILIPDASAKGNLGNYHLDIALTTGRMARIGASHGR